MIPLVIAIFVIVAFIVLYRVYKSRVDWLSMSDDEKETKMKIREIRRKPIKSPEDFMESLVAINLLERGIDLQILNDRDLLNEFKLASHLVDMGQYDKEDGDFPTTVIKLKLIEDEISKRQLNV